jgi:hypothetical protein
VDRFPVHELSAVNGHSLRFKYSATYTLTDCINYLTQLASFGCIAAYFAVCLATPFYLFAKKILRLSILKFESSD